MTDAPIIFHCASLGEYEQALPIIFALKKQRPDENIWVSFFSPSVYHNAEIPKEVDYYCYLPADTSRGMKRFIASTKPKAFISIKYEIWPNLIRQCKKKQIPFLLLAAHFRANQVYFKPWGGFFRKALKNIHAIATQYNQAKSLVEGINPNTSLMGDTRFERVSETAKQAWQDDRIEQFCDGEKVLMLGSCWEEELNILHKTINEIDSKIILAPHRVDDGFVNKIEQLFAGRCERYSDPTKGASILIIDKIGILKYAYRHAYLAFVGGGFKNALHNILEPLAYGIPVCFGPETEKYPESKACVKENAGFVVSDAGGLAKMLKERGSLNKYGENAQIWVSSNLNASTKAVQLILSIL